MPSWTRDTVIAALHAAGVKVVAEKLIQYGSQLTLYAGTIVCVYTSGKVNVQGRKSSEREQVEKLLNTASQQTPTGGAASGVAEGVSTYGRPVELNKVFIVYGHDTMARRDLELFLHRLGLEPIVLANMVPKGNTIIEALEEHSGVRCAIVLLTPDDEGFPIGDSSKKRPRARQNVVLEMGMFLAKLGREKVIILHKGELELPSDIHGYIYLPFKDSVMEQKAKLGASLQAVGFFIDIAKLSAE